jgi:outer membrane protein
MRAQQQPTDSVWSLQKCIDYAMQENIQVRQTMLNTQVNDVNYLKAKAARFPSVTASVGQNLGWSKTLDAANKEYGSYSSSVSTNYAVTANVTLFNGNKISNTIKQSNITSQAGQLDVETQKESIGLSVMDAYLQVLYAEEQVKNYQKQIESTDAQFTLAEERFKLGAISKSDYLQVKSELASERQSLANAESTLAIARVSLMQLLEIPVNNEFTIAHPTFGENINEHRQTNAISVYEAALGIKPQVKSAELNEQSAQLDVNIARAAYYPSLSLSAGMSTGYLNNFYDMSYGYQVSNKLTPSVGLTLSIPIFQNRQARSGVDIAKIGTQTAQLNTIQTKNQLRKDIEQACVDVTSAEKEYEASLEGYNATNESYQVASEKFAQGAINSSDYLIQKTNFIKAESQLLQSKYNLIFAYKTLDFYSGKPLAF